MHKFLDNDAAVYVDLRDIDIIRKSYVAGSGSIVCTKSGNGFHTATLPEDIAAMVCEAKGLTLTE